MPGEEWFNCQCPKCKALDFIYHERPATKPGQLNPWQINHEQPKITISFGGFYQVPDWTC
jgi:hypothetical protein